MDNNVSYFMVNDKGYFGKYLFREKHKHFNYTKIDSLIELSDDSNKNIIIEHPKYDDLLDNMDKLESLNVIILLDLTQDKEIKLLDNYFPRLLIDSESYIFYYELTNLTYYDFLGLDNFSQTDLKQIVKTKEKYKLLYIFNEFKDILNLNPSKLLNFKMNETISFSFSDFKNLNKNKYPKSYALLNSDSFEYFYKTLYSELVGVIDLELEIMQRFNDMKLINKEKQLSIKKYSKEELNAIEKLKRQGEIFSPDENHISKL